MGKQSRLVNLRGVQIRRWLPIFILVCGLVACFALGLQRYLSFEALRDNRIWLSEQVEAWGPVAILLFMVIYATAIAFSVPGGAILTIAGGFLFGEFLATICVVFAATLGAVVVFLAARTALGDMLRARAGPWLHKMEAGFRENAISYMLVLRLVPLFPFFVVNLVPAFLGVSLRTYAIATFIGIIPGTFVYASVGNGLGTLFALGETPDLNIIFKPDILVPILGLAILALIPVVYRKWKARRVE